MKVITDFEIVDHGIEHNQYFQGCGTAFTSFDYCDTGCGSNLAEAYDDACEQIACGPDSINFDGFDERVLKDIGKRKFPVRPAVTRKYSDDHYYYLSIRYNLADEIVEVMK